MRFIENIVIYNELSAICQQLYTKSCKIIKKIEIMIFFLLPDAKTSENGA